MPLRLRRWPLPTPRGRGTICLRRPRRLRHCVPLHRWPLPRLLFWPFRQQHCRQRRKWRRRRLLHSQLLLPPPRPSMFHHPLRMFHPLRRHRNSASKSSAWSNSSRSSDQSSMRSASTAALSKRTSRLSRKQSGSRVQIKLICGRAFPFGDLTDSVPAKWCPFSRHHHPTSGQTAVSRMHIRSIQTF